MIKEKLNALEWYNLDAITRQQYTPRKLTYKDYRELNKVGQLQLKRKIESTIQKARLMYALENTSQKKRTKFINKYGGKALKNETTGEMYNEQVMMKYSVGQAINKYYGIGSYKTKQGKGSKGGVDDLGWYIEIAREVSVDSELIDKLDAIANNASWIELQQLYAQLPDLNIYYPSNERKRTMELSLEFDEMIENTINDYMYELEKTSPDKAMDLWEEFDNIEEYYWLQTASPEKKKAYFESIRRMKE